MTETAGQGDATGLALSGVIVLELGGRIGAGVCGSLLAQLGATVILVEGGDDRLGGKWRRRAACAAGKVSLKIDASEAADCDLLRNVIERSDVVLLSSDTDHAFAELTGSITERDRIVCDVTAYGRDGPLAGQDDSEWQIQALTGIVETTGSGEGRPTPIPLPIVEYMTGVYAAGAVVAALRVKNSTDRGQFIDMALYDCGFGSMATFLPRILTGSVEPIRRVGNRHAMIAPWNVYRATDGWILVCVGSDGQWQRLSEIMHRPELRNPPFAKVADRVANVSDVDAAMQAWIGKLTIDACMTLLNEAQIACGPIVRIADGYPHEPNLDHRDMIKRIVDQANGLDTFVAGSPLRMDASPGRTPSVIPAPDSGREQVHRLLADKGARRPKAEHTAAKAPALAGIRIVEIGHYTTVPLSTRMLASLGAEVIKIEPPEGEATRPWPPTQAGQGYFFTYMNSDKRSIVLDLRKDADAAILRDLIKTADVLIENLKPGALAKRGFSAAEVAALNPRTVLCSVSGFGANSLYAGRPAYDSVIQAMSGLMDMAQSDGVPMKTGISTADLLGAEMAVLAVLAALAHRDRTGRGQYIDLSMQDIAAWLTEPAWNDTDLPALSMAACSDGFVLAECDADRLGAMKADRSRSEFDMKRDDLVAILKESNVRAAPVLSVREVVAAPQTAARRLWFTVTEDGASWPLLASPLRLTGTPPAVRKPMPALGKDNQSLIRHDRALSAT
ncbi:CoA transferase [Bradyrhizobium sp. dw_411]|uniref:CaiB/BaiF CoA-transferase family protein n=1 Tax=Bradyrhizobium sp. dw_411 TaxID=2720082 RepID=UPI001BCC69B7|nr:CoA transferase [Bradyrhizobium sp. dw_411]